MRSSERLPRSRPARIAGVGVACALAACGSPVERPLERPLAAPLERPAQAQPAASAAALGCEPPAGGVPAARAAELAALRAMVERGPLFAALAAGRVPVCGLGLDGSRWQLDYRFADDTTLSVTRDTSIEYTDFTAHVQWPAGSDPRELLQRAERASFTSSGCGIDWRQPAEASATTQVWRGDVCQCQARVQRDGANRVVALVLRSAC